MLVNTGLWHLFDKVVLISRWSVSKTFCVETVDTWVCCMLQLMLCGMMEVDVDDWERNTIYRHYQRNSKQVVWFWKVIMLFLHASWSFLLSLSWLARVFIVCQFPVSMLVCILQWSNSFLILVPWLSSMDSVFSQLLKWMPWQTLSKQDDIFKLMHGIGACFSEAKL